MPTGVYERTEYHREICKKAQTGRKHSKETKKKMSISRKKHMELYPKENTAFKKGHIPWIKGEHPEYLQGKNHPMYGIRKIGNKNPHWKGGKVRKSSGYIYKYQPNHPYKVCFKQRVGGYVLEHRLIMEQILKRYLKRFEKVHHLNGIRDDNRPENLKLYVDGKNWHPKTCPQCGFGFLIR